MIISLHVSGLQKRFWKTPSGSRFLEGNSLPPALFVLPPGIETGVVYSRKRENWVVQLESPDLRLGSDPDHFEIREGRSWIDLPIHTRLGRVELAHWQKEMLKMQRLVKTPLPINDLRLRSSLMSLFGFIAEKHTGTGGGGSPAGRLRELIDRDSGFAESIEQHCRKLRYSEDHLRALFTSEFGLSPHVYRTRLQMARAAELIAKSPLSLKEISAELGFRHASHFSAAFKRHFKITPSALLKEKRYS